jgi:hypothetical protein
MEGKVTLIVRGKEVLREPRLPSADMTWVQVEKYLRRHRHSSVKRWRYRTHRYAATFASSAVLGQQAAAAVQQVGSAQAEQVVIADGARWIKTQTQRHFPAATCILDWPHLWRTIAKAVLEQWQQEQKGHPPIKALTAAITYLDSQRDWIGHYEQWQQQGYPVGSGLIERAVAVVLNRRMKRQGMSW